MGRSERAAEALLHGRGRPNKGSKRGGRSLTWQGCQGRRLLGVYEHNGALGLHVGLLRSTTGSANVTTVGGGLLTVKGVCCRGADLGSRGRHGPRTRRPFCGVRFHRERGMKSATLVGDGAALSYPARQH